MRILICDDESKYLDLLQIHVHEYMANRYIPYEITTATDPVSILQGGQSFDLAFLDIQMEGLDGIETAKRLRTQNENLLLLFHLSWCNPWK